MITIEEGAIGGFGSFVLHHLAMTGQLDNGLKIRTMVLPDVFLDHDSPNAQYETAGLNARHIVATALAALGRDIVAAPGASLRLATLGHVGARASVSPARRARRPASSTVLYLSAGQRHAGAGAAPRAAALPAPLRRNRRSARGTGGAS